MDLYKLTKPLLLLYLFIATDHIKNLYGGQFRDFIKDSRVMQHIIGFIGMLVIINLASDIDNIKTLLLYTTLGYVWFLLTTKLNIYWNLALFAILVIAYLYQANMESKESKTNKDPSLYDDDKVLVKYKNTQTNKVMFYTVLGITAIGILIYGIGKYTKYGQNFDIYKFIFNDRNT